MRAYVLESMMVILPLVFAAATIALGADRSEVPEKYRWDLSNIYPSRQAADAAKERIVARLPELKKFEGKLGDSGQSLYGALETMMELDRDLSRLYVYANSLRDEDTRVADNLAFVQSVEQIAVTFGAATAFVRPEIIALPEAKVSGFLAKEPRLAPYRPFLDDILRRKPHTRGPAEEKIIAQAANMSGAGDALHSIFTNADMPYPEVTLSSGEKVRLDAAAYTKYRAASSREDRVRVFKSFWGSYQNFRRTLASSLYAQVKAHMFVKDARGFDSALAASLFTYNIPEKVYRQLIDDVHTNLPTLHRYLKLRQRMMSLPALGYEDLYAPLVLQGESSYTPEQAQQLVLEAVKPLGPEYQSTMKRAFDERWIDWLPSTGKRSGAYSTGVYGVHPYQLQNFMGKYDDVSTLAHELGHSMHTYLSDRNQPYVTHDYSLFVAEVASTFNEALLLDRMLQTTQDPDKRLALLGNHLELLRGTLFRQTMFAEFELLIHEMAERGESLTGDNLNALYLDLVRKYYGHDAGVCTVDDLYSVEWAYIPHFYWNFYVYQYATSLIASTSLARAVVDEKPGTTKARDAYLRMLSSGSSKYPIDLLKDAGVDMTTSAPFRTAMAEMNRTMDEMEAILAKKK